MATYTTYEAKARFTELLRKVRGGETVRISYHGVEVAELRPVDPAETPETTMARLMATGILEKAADPTTDMRAITSRPGALERFLEERE